jgi:integrase/recombinase XerD
MRTKPEITTAIILETRFPNVDEKYPVKLRVTYQRKRKYYAIKGYHYSVDEFNAIMNPDSRGKNKEIRKKFEETENRAIKIIDEVLNVFSFDSFEREYLSHKVKDTSIQSYFETKAAELDEKNKIQTATLYRAVLKSLTEFDSKINFQKVTPDYLKKYEAWMLKEENSYTSIGIYLRHFKHIINRAITDRVISEYPFGTDKNKYQIPEGKNTKKALTINDIEKLFNYKTDSKNEFLALQYFLFSYLANGMNMADVANLKYKNINGNNIEFYRQKTIDTVKVKTLIRVYLMPEILKIIKSIGNETQEPDNYIFPIYKSSFSEIEKHNRLKQHIKLTNKYIRRVAAEIGIDAKITTYYARHSYSTILKRSGASIEFIGEQLGHQNTKTTQIYLDSFEDEHRAKHSASLINFK